MTNAEKYKTPHERAVAFVDFCQRHRMCKGCPLIEICSSYEKTYADEASFAWLDLEAESEVAE